MTLNKLSDPSVLQIGRVLKIPGAAESASPAIGTTLPDGSQTVSPPAGGPSNQLSDFARAAGQPDFANITSHPTGKQGFPLSCRMKVAGQIPADVWASL